MYFLLAYANTIAITKDVNVNRPTMDHNAARRDLRDEEEAMLNIYCSYAWLFVSHVLLT